MDNEASRSSAYVALLRSVQRKAVVNALIAQHTNMHDLNARKYREAD